MVHLTVCYYHVLYAFQSESILYCLSQMLLSPVYETKYSRAFKEKLIADFVQFSMRYYQIVSFELETGHLDNFKIFFKLSFLLRFYVY